MRKRDPLILDFDGAIGAIEGATTIPLGDWQEAIRFGCTLRTFDRLRRHLAATAPAEHGTVLMGSGDYHHLTWPLVERQRARGPFQLVVFDNHPDNMRFPWGIHCGSWVRKVAMLPYVLPVGPSNPSSTDVRARSIGNAVPVIAHAPSGFLFVVWNAAKSRSVSRSSCSIAASR